MTAGDKRHTAVVFCRDCGATFPEGFVQLCPHCDGFVDVRYAPSAAALGAGPDPFDRYLALLPVQDRLHLPQTVPTPCRATPQLAHRLGLDSLYLKDETVLPTRSTKDRMAAVALAFMWERGVRTFCTSSTGNSSSAFIHAIPRFPGMRMNLFTAESFGPRVLAGGGTQVVHYLLQDATFVDAAKAAMAYAAAHGLTAERGFFNPGRREGLKLAFMEATEQVAAPIDWYVQAVSSAMGVVGTFHGALQLQACGRLPRLPRLLCVQQDTCAPMARAWLEGATAIGPHHIVDRPTGLAEAILRGDPTRAYPVVRACVSASDGAFVIATQSAIRAARAQVSALGGARPCYAAAAAVAGLAEAIRRGVVARDAVVLVNLTGADRLPAATDGAVILVRSGATWVPAPSTSPDAVRRWADPEAGA